MRPPKTSIFIPALQQFIQFAQAICGKELPPAESISSTLSGCGAVEVWAIPKDPEPGLDRVLIARIDLEGHPSCR
ncbi:hypothetical protein [Roseibium alexandrii]|uniref:Uncharacterized protein n=1 Tax=Roseibium alexandrii TaxID=388408 RepID=A0A0M7A4T5_9HYPH|nr:hypothetical protein [Roseibium alexandrii]CTQ69502.1 hypothetical protein LAX5112_02137 [Roseibium alexandrii]